MYILRNLFNIHRKFRAIKAKLRLLITSICEVTCSPLVLKHFCLEIICLYNLGACGMKKREKTELVGQSLIKRDVGLKRGMGFKKKWCCDVCGWKMREVGGRLRVFSLHEQMLAPQASASREPLRQALWQKH